MCPRSLCAHDPPAAGRHRVQAADERGGGPRRRAQRTPRLPAVVRRHLRARRLPLRLRRLWRHAPRTRPRPLAGQLCRATAVAVLARRLRAAASPLPRLPEALSRDQMHGRVLWQVLRRPPVRSPSDVTGHPAAARSLGTAAAAPPRHPGPPGQPRRRPVRRPVGAAAATASRPPNDVHAPALYSQPARHSKHSHQHSCS